MDVVGRLSCDANLSHKSEPLENVPDVVGLDRHRDRLEPREPTDAMVGDLIEQRIELCELLSAQACHERCGGLLACSGTASDASTLDRRDRWQQDSRLPQACNNAGGDDQAFVGRPGGLCCGFDH